MFEEILKFILENIKSLFYGVLLFTVSLIFLPSSVIVWLLKKIKPSIFLDEERKWKNLFSLLINILLYKSFTDFNKTSHHKDILDQIKNLHTNNSIIEKNLYFLDLSEDTLSMLVFAVPNATGRMDYDIFSEAINYLNHYTQYVTPFPQDENFANNIYSELNKLEEDFDSMERTRHQPNYDEQFSNNYFQHRLSNTRDYIKADKNKLTKLIEANKAKIKNLIQELLDDKN